MSPVFIIRTITGDGHLRMMKIDKFENRQDKKPFNPSSNSTSELYSVLDWSKSVLQKRKFYDICGTDEGH